MMKIVAYAKEAFWEFKEFYAAAVAFLVPVINYFFDLGLDQNTVLTLVVLVATILIGKELRERNQELQKIKAFLMSRGLDIE